jgi:hypothetical protein
MIVSSNHTSIATRINTFYMVFLINELIVIICITMKIINEPKIC